MQTNHPIKLAHLSTEEPSIKRAHLGAVESHTKSVQTNPPIKRAHLGADESPIKRAHLADGPSAADESSSADGPAFEACTFSRQISY